jgi:uncharacterized protein YjbJ (UPF0337 family)
MLQPTAQTRKTRKFKFFSPAYVPADLSRYETCTGLSSRPKQPLLQGEDIMNWDQVTGNWKQFTGKVKEKWGKLTDDELTVIGGKRDQLAGLLQERYGYTKEQAEKEIHEFSQRLGN